jgi:hypothetical protein
VAIFWRLADLRPLPKITCTELDLSSKFEQDDYIPSKVTQLFNPERHTDTCPPINMWMGEYGWENMDG